MSAGDVHYHGQIPALNDCVHRYMYKTKYLLMHDPDEVVVPTGTSVCMYVCVCVSSIKAGLSTMVIPDCTKQLSSVCVLY